MKDINLVIVILKLSEQIRARLIGMRSEEIRLVGGYRVHSEIETPFDSETGHFCAS